jgi:hypothetical protein
MAEFQTDPLLKASLLTGGTKNVEQDQFADIVVEAVRERFGTDAAAHGI